MRPNLFSNGRWYFPLLFPSAATGQTTAYFMSTANGSNLPFSYFPLFVRLEVASISDVLKPMLFLAANLSGVFSGLRSKYSLFHVDVRFPPRAAVTFSGKGDLVGE